MQCSTPLIQQLIVGLTFWTTALVHAQTACQLSTTENMPKSLIQTQRNSRPTEQTILNLKTQLNNCEFPASDTVTVAEYGLDSDTQNILKGISTTIPGPQSMVRLLSFSCAKCSTKKEGFDLRITQTVNAYANNNNDTCKPTYIVQSESVSFQTLKGCDGLSIEHLVELVQTGPVMSADPYVFSTAFAFATFKLSRNTNPDYIKRKIPLNSKAFLVSPCKVVLRRSVQR